MTSVCYPNLTGVSIGGRGLLIEGPPGAGKSTLALALVDRGAVLIGDDGLVLRAKKNQLQALPPETTRGMLEIRNVGIVHLECAPAPVCLLLTLTEKAPRFTDRPDRRCIEGHIIPALLFRPGDAVQAIRAEWALAKYGRRAEGFSETTRTCTR